LAGNFSGRLLAPWKKPGARGVFLGPAGSFHHGDQVMSLFRLLPALAVLSTFALMPAQAQQAMSEPAYCAQFYPGANCQNKGPGNPYTDPNYRRSGGQSSGQWANNETVGVAPRRTRHRDHSAPPRMQ
jgi:hypothetical protein